MPQRNPRIGSFLIGATLLLSSTVPRFAMTFSLQSNSSTAMIIWSKAIGRLSNKAVESPSALQRRGRKFIRVEFCGERGLENSGHISRRAKSKMRKDFPHLKASNEQP